MDRCGGQVGEHLERPAEKPEVPIVPGLQRSDARRGWEAHTVWGGVLVGGLGQHSASLPK